MTAVRKSKRKARARSKRTDRWKDALAKRKAERKAAWAAFKLEVKGHDEAALARAVWNVFGVDVKYWPRKSPFARG